MKAISTDYNYRDRQSMIRHCSTIISFFFLSSPSSVSFSSDHLLPFVDTHHRCLSWLHQPDPVRCRVYPVIDTVAYAGQSIQIDRVRTWCHWYGHILPRLLLAPDHSRFSVFHVSRSLALPGSNCSFPGSGRVE